MLQQSFRFKAIILPREGFSIPNFAFGTKKHALVHFLISLNYASSYEGL